MKINVARTNVANIITYLFKPESTYIGALRTSIHVAQFEKRGTHNFTYKGTPYISHKLEPILPLDKPLKTDIAFYKEELNRIQSEYRLVSRFLMEKEDYYNYLPDGLSKKLNISKPLDKTHEIPEAVYNLILEKTLNILLG